MASLTENRTIESVVQGLIRLDHDAIAAYEAALERIEDEALKPRLATFCDDHRRHTESLATHLRAMGADIPSGAEARRLLTQGKVAIGGLIGDKAILTAMRANEDLTNRAYAEAFDHVEGNPDLRATLASNLADERRHRDWMAERIGRL